MKEQLFEAAFVLFTTDKEIKDKIVDAFDLRPDVSVVDVYYDSDGDWNIECIATITSRRRSVDTCVRDIVDHAPYAAWDYHYIKGIDNDYYWQP